MGAFKKLNKADISTSPYYANKRWEIEFGDEYAYYHVGVYMGQNVPFHYGQGISFNQHSSLVYSSINHLFYQAYPNPLDTGSLLLLSTDNLPTASSQRPTHSYFDYNNHPYLIKNFPTGANENILVISIDKNTYGNKILPHSFTLSLGGTPIADDGYGNLFSDNGGGGQIRYIQEGYITEQYFETQQLPPGVNHAGNIFYAHGIVVLTANGITSTVPQTTCTTYKVKSGFVYNMAPCVGGLVAASPVYVPLSSFDPVYCVSSLIDGGGGGSAINIGSCTSPAPVGTLSFENEHIIYENEVHCLIQEGEFNSSLNPTLASGSYEMASYYDFVTGSDFHPYVTSIGLYNDTNDLLMVAKLGKPIMISPDTDMTFVVKYDT